MSKISESAIIADTAILYDDVEIQDDVIIHDYTVVHPGTLVGAGTEVFEYCVLGRRPVSPRKTTSRKLRNDYGKLIVGSNCVICPGCVLYVETTIGDNVLLGDHCSIREECVVGNNSIISRNVSVNYNTSIGHNTKIMDNTHITGNMSIGNHVFISVLVATTNDNTMGREKYNEDYVIGATIEDYVTVGAGANILPRVTIGRNAVVGAGALVTKDVPADKVVMGIPARIVRDV